LGPPSVATVSIGEGMMKDGTCPYFANRYHATISAEWAAIAGA
jgi:hypothetical protein